LSRSAALNWIFRPDDLYDALAPSDFADLGVDLANLWSD
jgi:hypothetical protein